MKFSDKLTLSSTAVIAILFSTGATFMKDTLINQEGEKVKLSVPEGDELPSAGFTQGSNDDYIKQCSHHYYA